MEFSEKELVLKIMQNAFLEKLKSFWTVPASLDKIPEHKAFYAIASEFGIKADAQVIGLVERVIRENAAGEEYVEHVSIYYFDTDKYAELLKTDPSTVDFFSYVSSIIKAAMLNDSKFWRTSLKYSFEDESLCDAPFQKVFVPNCLVPGRFFVYEVK